MDRRGARASILDVRDHDGVERDPAAEVQRAVDRIDDPEPLRLAQLAARALLGQHGDRGVVRSQELDDRLLGCVIRGGREVRAASLARDDADIVRDDRIADRGRGPLRDPRELRVTPRGSAAQGGQRARTLANSSLRSKGFEITSATRRSLNWRW